MNNRIDNAPTKAQMWEHILMLTEKCIDQSWSAGYSAGHKEGYNEAMAMVESEITIADLIEEVD